MTPDPGRIDVRLTAVVLAVTDEVPRVVVVEDARGVALPSGPLDPGGDRTLELALRRWVREQTGLELGHVEQLYTFGDRHRDPSEVDGARVLSVAYLALVREGETGRGRAGWGDVYAFCPWEDAREGRPDSLAAIEEGLEAWCAAGEGVRDARRTRADICFGQGGAAWDGDRVLERYELLYEAGLVEESWRDAHSRTGRSEGGPGPRGVEPEHLPGEPLVLDHRRILAQALGRIRGKIQYRPVVFELLPERFTLFRLQRLVEALAGTRLHKQNFRRLVVKGGLVEGTGEVERRTGGRPAELFRFREGVLRERPTPGVGLPGSRPAR